MRIQIDGHDEPISRDRGSVERLLAALVLARSEQRVRFDWGAEIDAQVEPTRVHWCAFYGDVDHTVENVDSGHRITLSYVLRPADTSVTSTDRSERLASPTSADAVEIQRSASFPEVGEETLSKLLDDRGALYVVPLHSSAANARHFLSCLYSDTNYFGNEASEAELYVFACLLVEIVRSERPRRGRRVVHPVFGEGIVVSTAHRGDEPVLHVQFDDAVRNVLERHVEDA